MNGTPATAHIVEVGGPVVRAATAGIFRLNEAVTVGAAGLLGEVLRLKGDEIVVQVFEDTTELKPGDPVQGSGRPLSVTLGPGLLGGIFDGLLRPLAGGEAAYIRPGLHRVPPRRFRFTLAAERGMHLAGGAVFGDARAGTGRPQPCLVPPGIAGEVVAIAAPGSYREGEVVCRLGTAGGEHGVALAHRWPVRTPRPIRRRLPGDAPLITGQRLMDSLFPIRRGAGRRNHGTLAAGRRIPAHAAARPGAGKSRPART